MEGVLIIPDWSDLGSVSPKQRDSWLGEQAIREKYQTYFDGTIFERETTPLEYGSTEDAPETYPVGINLVRMLCEAQADSEFGEWEDQIISFQPKQDDTVGSAEKVASQIASDILATSNANSKMWEVSLHRNIYGGSPIQITPAITMPGWIKWTRVPIESFFPIWDPEDIDELLEVYIVTGMTREQARAKYGYDGDEKPGHHTCRSLDSARSTRASSRGRLSAPIRE